MHNKIYHLFETERVININYSTLAENLRSRLITKGLVEKNILAAIPDSQIIDCYITCSCCGEKSVKSKTALDQIILSSKNVEEFLEKTRVAH
ncbi:MAG: hypothetical protein H6622_13180 [Halobacteriovoraceae bacterium]|nr:hypothetical protein [Halobacteriovoraceae bacterium]